MEEWKVIPEHPKYMVSNLGNVMSCLSGSWKPRKLKRVVKGNARTKDKGRFYLGINLQLDEKLPSGYPRTKTVLVHNLVAEQFIGPRPPGHVVMHIDDNRDNNTVNNLRYGTQSENMQLAVRNGKLTPIRGHAGKFAGARSGS